MGDFFHGWRRKIGVVTLLMTLVFAVDFWCWFSRANPPNEIPETAMMLDAVEIAALLPISIYLLLSHTRPKTPPSYQPDDTKNL